MSKIIDNNWLANQKKIKEEISVFTDKLNVLEIEKTENYNKLEKLIKRISKIEKDIFNIKTKDRKEKKLKKREYKDKLYKIQTLKYEYKNNLYIIENSIKKEKKKIDSLVNNWEETQNLKEISDQKIINSLIFNGLQTKLKIDYKLYETKKMDHNTRVGVSFGSGLKPRFHVSSRPSIRTKEVLVCHEKFEIRKTDNFDKRILEISNFLNLNKPSNLKNAIEYNLLKSNGSQYLDEFKNK